MHLLGVQMIGRDEERAAIERALAGPHPLALVIEGEAGIGKTTVWSHALTLAAERGQRVLSWRASPVERELAFGALMGLLDTVDDPALSRLTVTRRSALEIALGRQAPGGRPPEPSMVGLALVDLARGLAAEKPLVIGLDDVQWCDAPSENALTFAARRLGSEPIALVLASRTVASLPRSAGVEEALPSDRRNRVTLGPLTVGALGRVIRDRLGVTHPRPLLVRLHEACNGNPFVALEMSRSLAARGAEPGPGEPFPVPPEAGPLVRDHLATLSAPARQALLVVAMSSQPSLALLDRVFRRDSSSAVDEACRKGVLIADGSRLRAAHPLFASTAYGAAPPGERRDLRRALAGAVDDPVERAVHLAATFEDLRPSDAAAFRTGAAAALGRGAPGVAAGLLERAAELAAPSDARASLRIDAAEAHMRAGDADRATVLLRGVLASMPTGRRRAEALLALGEIVYIEHPSECLELLREALDHTEGDPLLEAAVHSHVAALADNEPDAWEGSALAAVEILQRHDLRPDPDHLACALLERAYLWLSRAERIAQEDVDRALSLLSGEADTFVTRRARWLAISWAYRADRLDEALRLIRAEYRRRADLGEAGLLPEILQPMVPIEQLAGDWRSARAHAEEIKELVQQGEVVWLGSMQVAQSQVLGWEGDLEAARTIALEGLAATETAGDDWGSIIFRRNLGFIELSVQDPAAALRHLARAGELSDAIGVALPTMFRFAGDLVEAAVLSGELETAERALVARLERPAERVPLPWILEVAARGRGLLAAARGDMDDAITWFDRSLDVLDAAAPMPFERGRTLLARGQAQRRVGHRRAAAADLDAAQAIFQGLGAKIWERRAAGELRKIGGRVASTWDLTPSERSVAELAAAGRSNQEIADQLVLSVRTVESHLSAAYRKLGIRSRAQLGAHLARAETEG